MATATALGLIVSGAVSQTASAQSATGYVGDFHFSEASSEAQTLTTTTGTTTLTGTHTFSSVNNGVGATLINDGATSDDLNNSGAMTNNSVYTANVASNTGTLTNSSSGVWNGDIEMGANVKGAVVVNQGKWSGSWTNDGGSTDNQGVLTGSVSNNAGTFTNEGSAGAILVNKGSATNSGTIVGDVGNASVFVNNAKGEIGGALANSGTATNNGLIEGGVAQSGIFTNNTGAIVDGGLANSGGASTNNGAVNGGADVSAGSLTNNSRINGAVAIDGARATLSNNGVIDGAVTNSGADSILVDNAKSAITGSVTTGSSSTTQNNGLIQGGAVNNGLLTNDASGIIKLGLTNNAGETTNNGLIDDGATLKGGTLVNSGTLSGPVGIAAPAVLDNNNEITGAIANAGQFVNNGSGAVSAALTNTGAATNNGALDGGVHNFAAFVNNAGALVEGGLDNRSGTTANAGSIQGGAVVSGGALTSTGTIAGGLTNSATVYAVGALSGAIVNTGALVVGDGSSALGKTLTIGAGSSVKGVITIPVNLTTGKSNVVAAAGASVSGATITFTGVLANPSKAYWGDISYSNTPMATDPAILAELKAISSPLYVYSDNSGEKIVQTINPGLAATAANHASAILTAMNASFFGNPANFLRAPAEPTPNLWSGAVWSRGGGADLAFDSASASGAAPSFNASRIETRLAGAQFGIEEGLFNIQNSGMSLHFGVTGGEVVAATSDQDIAGASASSTAPFIGGYAALTGNGLYAVAQARFSQFNMNITDAPLAVVNQHQSAAGMTYSGEVGYHAAILGAFFLEPSAALLVSRMQISNEATNVGVLSFGALQSELGRLSLRIGADYVFERVGFEPYVTGSVWREFQGAPTTYIPGGPVITQTAVGAFGQASLGISATLWKAGLTAYAQGDLTLGSNVHGWGATGGVRYSF